jgi:glycosyltransferase domain-containing protein
MSKQQDQLTVILPTRNRSQLVVAMLKLFKSVGFRHRIIIADSSDTLNRSLERATAKGAAIMRRYPPDVGLYEKLVDVAASVTTPFVLTIPDKKFTLPYGIDELLACLQSRADYVAASGYVLRYAMQEPDIDIYRVHIFTPSIVDEDPLRRVFKLMRRYQPSAFALFRTEALLACAKQASAVRGLIFQEIMFMNALVLQGKVARLPVVFGLHGPELSHSPFVQRDPMHWFLADGRSFLEHYRRYCDVLAAHILRLGIRLPDGVDLNRLLDLIHASWLGHNVDTGKINHVVRGLLGEDMPPLVEGNDWPGPRPIGPHDRVDRRFARSHIWRHAVLEAEPRDEITIRDRDIREVNDTLDIVLLD